MIAALLEYADSPADMSIPDAARKAASLLAEDKGGGVVDTAGAFPEWKAGTSSFKQWCAQYFGPDADESYLAEAVLQLPRKQILPMKAADEFELHRLLAEERYTVRQLNRALRDATEPPTFMGEPVTRPQQQAAQAAVPHGWELVPVEPTQEMLAAAWKQGSGGGWDMEGPEPIYRAMLSAAPAPVEQKGEA